MPFVPAKCTQCGSNIQVDDSKELGICASCGTPFITERVINNYVTNNVVTQTFSTVNNITGGEIHIHQNGESADEAYATLVGLIARGKIFGGEDESIFSKKWKAFGEKYPLDPRRKELDVLCWVAECQHGEREKPFTFVRDQKMLESLKELKAIDKAAYEKCAAEAAKAINTEIAKTADRTFEGNMLDVKILLGDVNGLEEVEQDYNRYVKQAKEYKLALERYEQDKADYARKSAEIAASGKWRAIPVPIKPLAPEGSNPYTKTFWEKLERATARVNEGAYPADEAYAECAASVLSKLYANSSLAGNEKIKKLLVAFCKVLPTEKTATYLKEVKKREDEQKAFRENNEKKQAVTIINRTKCEICYYAMRGGERSFRRCAVRSGSTQTDRFFDYGVEYGIFVEKRGLRFLTRGKIGAGEPTVYEITQKLFGKFVIVKKDQGKTTVSIVKV